MKRFMENKPRFIRGHLGLLRRSQAESALSFDVSASSIPQGGDEGARIKLAFPSDDPIPIFETRIGIFKGAADPQRAPPVRGLAAVARLPIPARRVVDAWRRHSDRRPQAIADTIRRTIR